MTFKITNISLKTFTKYNKNYNNINYTIFIKQLNKTINITKQYINFKTQNYLIDIIDSIKNQNNLNNQLINFINQKY
jgi:tRNA A37 threonylcarbamoyladenosine dehydratase